MKRRAPKTTLVLRAIAQLWPEGVPDDMGTSAAAIMVHDWIRDYCRRNGFAQITVGSSTIRNTLVRAAPVGRFGHARRRISRELSQ